MRMKGQHATVSSGRSAGSSVLRLREAGKIHFLPVLTDGFHNFQRQSQRSAAIFERDLWRGALANRTKKRLQLRVQRLFGGDRRFGDANLGISRRRSRLRPIVAYGENQDLLSSVVERNILPWLEKTKLTHPLGRNAAGSEVRDAAGFQLQPDVRDVHFP